MLMKLVCKLCIDLSYSFYLQMVRVDSVAQGGISKTCAGII